MNNKRRIIALLDYLKENTNADHHIKTEDIVAHLEDEGFKVERKTIYSDVSELNEMKYEIGKAHDGYYYNNEPFDLAELRVLVDSVKAASFLSKRKTEAIKSKLFKLTNCYDRKLLDDGQFEENKTSNEQIMYNIDAIMKAISQKKVIKFKMFDINVDGEKKYRSHNYDVYPRALVVNNGRYYLICTHIKHGGLSNYRLDHIEGVALTNKEYTDVEENVDVKQYMNKLFNMYNGEIRNITLKVNNKRYDEIVLHFGEDAIIQKKEKNYFVCNIKAFVSPTFFGWIFTLGSDIEILTPDDVREDYINECKRAIEKHEKRR